MTCFTMVGEVRISEIEESRVVLIKSCGALAQLVARFHGMEEVRGSNPLCSTISTQLWIQKCGCEMNPSGFEFYLVEQGKRGVCCVSGMAWSGRGSGRLGVF